MEYILKGEIMKKRYVLFATIIICVCLVIFLIINNKPKNEEKDKEFSYTPLTYKICDNDSCIHLMGSIHVGDDRVTKFNKNITDIYKRSDYLAVEVDTTDIYVDTNMFLLTSGTIDDLIDDSIKEKLANFSVEHILFPYDNLKTFTLGYLQNYISLLPAIESNLTSGGVDEYFLKIAHEDNKNIISLETYESQIAFFTDYSNDFYISQIEYAIDNYDEEKQLMKDLYEAYLTGDKDEIEKILDAEDEDMEMTEEEERYNKAMLYDRNEVMTEKVREFLNENKNVFMIVGEAHVLGEGGIIDLLQNENYAISIVR